MVFTLTDHMQDFIYDLVRLFSENMYVKKKEIHNYSQVTP